MEYGTLVPDEGTEARGLRQVADNVRSGGAREVITIGGIPASIMGLIASRVCSSVRDILKSKLNSLLADETQGKLQPILRL